MILICDYIYKDYQSSLLGMNPIQRLANTDFISEHPLYLVQLAAMLGNIALMSKIEVAVLNTLVFL